MKIALDLIPSVYGPIACTCLNMSSCSQSVLFLTTSAGLNVVHSLRFQGSNLWRGVLLLLFFIAAVA